FLVADCAGLSKARGIHEGMCRSFGGVMAGQAGSRCRKGRIPEVSGGRYRSSRAGQWDGVRSSNMALVAVPAVAGEAHLVEVVRGAAKAVNRIVEVQLFARVDLVNQDFEVHRLRRIGLGWPAAAVRRD